MTIKVQKNRRLPKRPQRKLHKRAVLAMPKSVCLNNAFDLALTPKQSKLSLAKNPKIEHYLVTSKINKDIYSNVKELIKSLRPKFQFNFLVSVSKPMAALVLSIGLLLQGGGLVSHKTVAAFNDEEFSEGNSVAAGTLDFKLTNNEPLVSFIGPEAGGEIVRVAVAMPEDGSLPMSYAGGFKAAVPVVDPLCQKLTMEAKRNGLPFYSGPLADFTVATSTEFGSWELRFDLPPTASAAHGDKCQGDLMFWAWPQGQDFSSNSFFDEESLPLGFTARMVVLNEIFANPAGGSAPKDREYLELYNNGNSPVDVLGWKISEIDGATETLHSIVATSTASGQLLPFGIPSTIIAPHGLLVLQFSGAASYLNDSGDTIKLYDGADQFLEGHTYPSTAAGKAHVRFPDGIGYWVDPEPTPGEPNVVTLEELRAAGFDEEQIAEMFKLAELMQSLAVDENIATEPPVDQTEAVPSDIADLDFTPALDASAATSSAEELLYTPADSGPAQPSSDSNSESDLSSPSSETLPDSTASSSDQTLDQAASSSPSLEPTVPTDQPTTDQESPTVPTDNSVPAPPQDSETATQPQQPAILPNPDQSPAPEVIETPPAPTPEPAVNPDSAPSGDAPASAPAPAPAE